MDAMKSRAICLRAASKTASDPIEMLRTAFAFVCYVMGGFNIAADVLAHPPTYQSDAPLAALPDAPTATASISTADEPERSVQTDRGPAATPVATKH